MEEFTKVYTSLYNSLKNFNVSLNIPIEKMDEAHMKQLYPVFRLINTQVEKDTVDDHAFLFTPLITEDNFFQLTETNRKVLLAFVKKLYSIQEKMNIEEPNMNSQIQQLMSTLDTTDITATEEDIQQAAATLGETLGLEENNPMRNVMHDIIHQVGNGLKGGVSIQDLIKNATESFRDRIKDDLESGALTQEEILKSQEKMVEKVEKLMRNPMAASSMMKTDDQKRKEKAERRREMRKKWRNKK